jgi:ribonuclease J
MPVKGEYRSMVNNANLAYEIGIPKENLLLKQNGDIVEFIDGKLQDKFESIKIETTLIDGDSSEDVGELVIKDREMLSESGIVLVVPLYLNKKKYYFISCFWHVVYFNLRVLFLNTSRS